MKVENSQPKMRPRKTSESAKRSWSTSCGPTNQKETGIIQSKRRTIAIEIILFIYCLAVIGDDPLLEQYIYHHFKQNYPILRNISQNEGSFTNCHNISKTDPLFVATQAVQADTAKLHSFLSISSSTLTCFTALIYGAHSDRAGRKPVLLLPCLAALIRIIINIFTIRLNWSIYCFLIGQVLDGLCGGFSTFLLALYSYLSDVTTIETRGTRMILADALIPLASSMANFIVGYSINATGYLPTYVFLGGLMALNLVLLTFFVPETVKSADENKLKCISITRSLKEIHTVFMLTKDRRHYKLASIVTAFFLCGVTYASNEQVRILLVLNIPLCWGSVAIGWYFGIAALVKQVGGIVGLKFFKWFLVPEIWIALIGVVSGVAGSLVNAWATTSAMMAAVPLLSLFVRLPQPLFRAVASRLVNKQEQATVLAGFASIGSVCYLVSAFVMNPIYISTLYIMPGFIYLVNALLGCLAVIAIILHMNLWRRSVPA